MAQAWTQVGNVWYSPYHNGVECIAVEPDAPGLPWRALVVQPHQYVDVEGTGPTRDAAVAALWQALERAGALPCPP